MMRLILFVALVVGILIDLLLIKWIRDDQVEI